MSLLSSTVNLKSWNQVELTCPDGYLIDLRYSGPIHPDASTDDALGTRFGEPAVPPSNDPDDKSPITITFDDSGAIDQVYYWDPNLQLQPLPAPPGGMRSVNMLDSFYLFIEEFEIDANIKPIDRPSNLWVTVNNTSGGANVGYSVPPNPNEPSLAVRILEARQIAQQQQSANQ